MKIKDIKKVSIADNEFLLVKFKQDIPLDTANKMFVNIKEITGCDRVLGYREDMAEFKVVKFL